MTYGVVPLVPLPPPLLEYIQEYILYKNISGLFKKTYTLCYGVVMPLVPCLQRIPHLMLKIPPKFAETFTVARIFTSGNRRCLGILPNKSFHHVSSEFYMDLTCPFKTIKKIQLVLV